VVKVELFGGKSGITPRKVCAARVRCVWKFVIFSYLLTPGQALEYRKAIISCPVFIISFQRGRRRDCGKMQKLRGVAFLIGLVASIVLGWWGFPRSCTVRKTSPSVRSCRARGWSGNVHARTVIHFGEWFLQWFPTSAKCVGCHEDVQGEDP
jgi:hypothetical protein